MKVLLDTHVFLWIFGDPDRFSKKIRLYLEAHAAEDSFVSDVTAWEASIKYGLGKLKLPESPEVFFSSRMRKANYRRLRIDLDHVTYVHKLPHIHRDPFDRLLIAQAIVEDFTILSDDPVFGEYPVNVRRTSDLIS